MFNQPQKLKRRSLIFDAGCDNGKYLGLNPKCYFVGCDISAPLIGICADKRYEVLVADAVNLPYRTGYVDAVISIVVLHHFSTECRRKKAVDELIRVVKMGGPVLITVWVREQEDKALVNKWTPLPLECIPENEDNVSAEPSKCFPSESLKGEFCEEMHANSNHGDDVLASNNEKSRDCQREYFVPWHLPYHRAEVSGAFGQGKMTRRAL